MFIWTTGMPPIVTLLLFLIGSVITVYSLAGAFRWTFGWSPDEQPPPARGRGPGGDAWPCRNPDCRAPNPPHARFCRMCGRRRAD